MSSTIITGPHIDPDAVNSGTVVTIPRGVLPAEIEPGVVADRNLLVEQFDTLKALIGDLSGVKVRDPFEDPVPSETKSIFEILNDLAEYAQGGGEYLTFVLPEGWQDILDEVVISPLTTITEEGRVTVPPFESTAQWPTRDVPVPQTLKPIPDVDLTYTDPIFPAEVDPDLVYAENPYISPYWDALFNKIYDVVVNGGTGLDSDVEDALWERAKERQRRERSESYQKLIDATSTDGFDFANGAQAAILLAADAEWAQQETNLNNEIAIKQADLAYQAGKDFTQMAIDLEKVLRQFHNDSENRVVEWKKAVAQFILQKFAEKVKGYAAQWEGIKQMLLARISEIEVVAKQNDTIAKMFGIEMDSYTAEVDLAAKKTTAEVEAYKGTIAGIQAQVDEKSAWWRALTEEQKNQVSRDGLRVEKALGEIKAMIDGNMSLFQFRERILETMAQIMAQVLASALQAVNTSVTYGANKSSSVGESYTHGDGLDESYPHEAI